MNEDKAVCSCMRVKYDPIKNDNGTMTERWKCSNCGREFRKKVDSGYIDIVGKPGTTKRLRTATVKIDIEILFDLMGIPFFSGAIHSLNTNRNGNELEMQIAGFDDRLPEKIDYPECNVMIKTIQGHFEEKK